VTDLGYDLCLVRDHSAGGGDDLRPDNLFDVHSSGEEALDHVATVVCEGSVIRRALELLFDTACPTRCAVVSHVCFHQLSQLLRRLTSTQS